MNSNDSSGSPPELRYAVFELTRRCNLTCQHCASGAGGALDKEMDLAAWSRVINDLTRLGCQAVDLMGGEVLMTPLLLPVGEALLESGLPWGILTNGWGLTQRRAKSLVSRGCRGMGVSLDGARAETHDQIRGRKGSFDRVMRALRVIAGLDFKASNQAVLTTVTAQNLFELEAIGELLGKKAPGFRWSINLCSASGPRMPKDFFLNPQEEAVVVRFLDQVRREERFPLQVTGCHDLGYFMEDSFDLYDHPWSGCLAGIHHLGIQADGKIKGCLALDESFTVGNLTESRLVDIWKDPERLSRYRSRAPDDLGPNCRDCPHARVCRGGCTAYSYSRTGQAHNHPGCLYRRQRKSKKPLGKAV